MKENSTFSLNSCKHLFKLVSAFFISNMHQHKIFQLVGGMPGRVLGKKENLLEGVIFMPCRKYKILFGYFPVPKLL